MSFVLWRRHLLAINELARGLEAILQGHQFLEVTGGFGFGDPALGEIDDALIGVVGKLDVAGLGRRGLRPRRSAQPGEAQIGPSELTS